MSSLGDETRNNIISNSWYSEGAKTSAAIVGLWQHLDLVNSALAKLKAWSSSLYIFLCHNHMKQTSQRDE